MEQGMFGTSNLRIKGTSGAYVEVFLKHAIKYSHEESICKRLNLQSHFMRSVGSPPFAKVFSIADGEYAMERLYELQSSKPADTLRFFSEVKQLARKYLWTGDRVNWPFLDLKKHTDYVRRRCAVNGLDLELTQSINRYTAVLHDLKLSVCTVHGDLTLGNAMLDNSAGIVLIDPIPSSEGMLNTRAADLGKLMQSAAGYETWFTDSLCKVDEDEAIEVILDCESDVDRVAAKYFRMIAWLRMLRYTSGSVRTRALQRLTMEAKAHDCSV